MTKTTTAQPKLVALKKQRTREQVEAQIWHCEQAISKATGSKWYALKGKLNQLNQELRDIRSFENLAR